MLTSRRLYRPSLGRSTDGTRRHKPHGRTRRKVARCKIEPYVAADVYALPPHTSRGGWTWYTGSAGWMNPLMVQSVLRLALEVDRLRFTSCLPSTWKGSRWLPVPCDVLQHRRAMHRSGRRERVERDSRWRGTGGQRLSSRRRRPGAPRRGCVRQSGTRSLIDPGLTSCFPLAGIEMPPGTTVPIRTTRVRAPRVKRVCTSAYRPALAGVAD